MVNTSANGQQVSPIILVVVQMSNLLRQVKQISRDSPDIGVNDFHRSIRVDDMDRTLRSGCFVEKTASESTSEVGTLTFHSVKRTTQAAVGGFNRHVEQKNAVRQNPIRRHSAHLPDVVRIEPAGVALIN